jgi:hypothetical protein
VDDPRAGEIFTDGMDDVTLGRGHAGPLSSRSSSAAVRLIKHSMANATFGQHVGQYARSITGLSLIISAMISNCPNQLPQSSHLVFCSISHPQPFEQSHFAAPDYFFVLRMPIYNFHAASKRTPRRAVTAALYNSVHGK